MKKMIILAVTLILAQIAIAGEWLTDLPKAQEQAKKDNKLVLLDFTGSDWCSWCIKFKKEVLETDEFKQYADKNLVLVEVDFPNKKVQSNELKQSNNALKEKYNVSGYPTYVVLNSAGKEVGRQVGYAPGGPKAFIEKLNGFQKK